MTTKKQTPKVVPHQVEILPNGDRLVYVYCPYCHEAHRHGWPREAKQEAPGHRFSPCADFAIRYTNDGYFICAPTKTKPAR